MHPDIEQLRELSLNPSRLCSQLSSARVALADAQDDLSNAARRHLESLGIVAEFVAGIAAGPLQILGSIATCYVFARLIQLGYQGAYSITSGPWISWSFLLSFDPVSLILATLTVALAMAVCVMLCRDFGRRLHHSLMQGSIDVNGRRSLRFVFGSCALALLVLLPLTCSIRDERTVAQSCGSSWTSRTLGQSWWLLQCPSGSPAGCAVQRNDRQEVFPGGHSLIVATEELRTIEFSSDSCARSVVLHAPSEASKPSDEHIVRLEPLSIKLDENLLSQITKAPLRVQLDVSGARKELDAVAAAITRMTTQLGSAVKLDVSGHVDTRLSGRVDADLDAPQLVNYLPGLIGELSSANRIAASALELEEACRVRPRADGIIKRTGHLVGGNQTCLASIRKLAASREKIQNGSGLTEQQELPGTPALLFGSSLQEPQP